MVSTWHDAVGEKYDVASRKKLKNLYEDLKIKWKNLFDYAERVDFFSSKAVEYRLQEEFINSCWVD